MLHDTYISPHYVHLYNNSSIYEIYFMLVPPRFP